MDKKRWVLTLMAVCLALAFSVSSVEAQKNCNEDGDFWVKDTKKCRKLIDTLGYLDIDCNDNDEDVGGPPVKGNASTCPMVPDPPTAPMGPRIVIVQNNSGIGGAVGYIAGMDVLAGVYSKLSIRNFNKMTPNQLRERYDVLYFTWGGSPSIEAIWPAKLEEFVKQGGSILWEGANANLAELVDGIGDLTVDVVEYKVEGDDPAVVEFEPITGPLNCSATGDNVDNPECYDDPEEILSAFVPGENGGGMNDSGYFMPVPGMTESDCLLPANNPSPDIQTLGLGYGCFVNNHFTFIEPAPQTWVPFLRLDDGAIGVYREFTDNGATGRMVLIGVDHGFHATGPGRFQANHFCALTNELIWLSQAFLTDDQVILDARNNCVENWADYLAQTLE